jgi:putative transcriptional regulator
MKTSHPAGDDLLIAYAAGTLSSAPALIVASQRAMLPDVAERLDILERIGGALLDQQAAAPLSDGLLDSLLARLDDEDQPLRSAEPDEHVDHDHLDLGMVLPAPLATLRIGDWRAAGPGIRTAVVDVPDDPLFKVVLLRAEAGVVLPRHGHPGLELSLVLKGRFSDDSGSYGPGDIDEADDSLEHQPRVSADGECICLIATERRKSCL